MGPETSAVVLSAVVTAVVGASGAVVLARVARNRPSVAALGAPIVLVANPTNLEAQFLPTMTSTICLSIPLPSAVRRQGFVRITTFLPGRVVSETLEDDVSDSLSETRLVASDLASLRHQRFMCQRRAPLLQSLGEHDQHPLADH